MTDEVIQVQEDFYILATSSRVDDRTRVLKDGDTFAVFNRYGDFEPLGRPELGLYHSDTRYLSRLAVRLGDARPLLLSSMVNRDNALLTVDLTNPDVQVGDEVVIPRGTIHVFRTTLLWAATAHHRLRIHNYDQSPVEFTLSIDFDADFADLFEVRGIKRERRGTRQAPESSGGGLRFTYDGLDGQVRTTTITFDPEPLAIRRGTVEYRVHLDAGRDATYEFAVRCGCAPRGQEPATAGANGRGQGPPFDQALEQASAARREAREQEPRVFGANRQFNEWLNRSTADLHMMRTLTPHGPYPYAGVPWFSTVFGRDGIITALECLWYDPDIARGVLAFLAATQADQEDPERDAQPGKILHETRGGEMSALGEVPFRRYYGSTDATPLFVMLAGAFTERTGDLDFARSIWPNVLRALRWMDQFGDVDGDGFLEYARRSQRGLVNQGWKDSHDAVFHADGELAEGPIALCEVQAYAYAARLEAATLARRLGHPRIADRLTSEAARLRERFEATFWNEDLGTYVLALDGHKRQCAVRTSNAGHCLYTGIAGEERARRVASALVDPSSFSGWGVRTVASGTPRYNPMSYHNGSIWPHDNALLAAGLARYGLRHEALTVFGALHDASLFFELNRLPELFCGFRRRPGEAPTNYPVSCSPQTWASAAVFLLLGSILGLSIRAADREVLFARPALPEFLPELHIIGLRVGPGRVDLVLTRHEHDVGVNVLRRDGEVRVLAVK